MWESVQGSALGRVFTGDISLVKETEMSHEVVEQRQADLWQLPACHLFSVPSWQRTDFTSESMIRSLNNIGAKSMKEHEGAWRKSDHRYLQSSGAEVVHAVLDALALEEPTQRFALCPELLPMLWFLVRFLATSLQDSPAPSIKAGGHVCSPFLARLPRGWLSCGVLASPQVFQSGTSMSASVGPCPN